MLLLLIPGSGCLAIGEFRSHRDIFIIGIIITTTTADELPVAVAVIVPELLLMLLQFRIDRGLGTGCYDWLPVVSMGPWIRICVF